VNIAFSADDLRPLVAAVVEQVLTSKADADSKHGNRLGHTEAEAAALIGVERHVLRDCRLRGEINAKLVGKKYIYSRLEIERFLKK
jgi:hypothetical protein